MFLKGGSHKGCLRLLRHIIFIYTYIYIYLIAVNINSHKTKTDNIGNIASDQPRRSNAKLARIFLSSFEIF